MFQHRIPKRKKGREQVPCVPCGLVKSSEIVPLPAAPQTAARRFAASWHGGPKSQAVTKLQAQGLRKLRMTLG